MAKEIKLLDAKKCNFYKAYLTVTSRKKEGLIELEEYLVFMLLVLKYSGKMINQK